MAIELIFSMLGFMWVTAITPGPNNMLLASSGANMGLRRSIPLMLGIMLGMQSLLLLVSLGVGSVLLLYPMLHTTLKILGSIYLLYIAWKLATAKYEILEPYSANTQKPITWLQGWLLQFLNPKAWLMAIGSVASFSLPDSEYHRSIVAISISMFIINLVAGILWLSFGVMIGRFLHSHRSWLTFNISMGLLTAVCVLLIWH